MVTQGNYTEDEEQQTIWPAETERDKWMVCFVEDISLLVLENNVVPSVEVLFLRYLDLRRQHDEAL